MVDFTKYARDKKQNKLEVGHVVFLDSKHAIVNKVKRLSRDKAPDIEVILVETNWRGENITTKKATWDATIYRKSNLIPHSQLRDDYALHKKILELIELPT